MSIAAPSVICELLPAVTLPYLRSKTGLSEESASALVSSRTMLSFCDTFSYFGGTTTRFQIRYGVNQIILIVGGGGEYVDLTILDPNVTACTNEVTVGTAKPQP